MKFKTPLGLWAISLALMAMATPFLSHSAMSPQKQNELVIYSARKEKFVAPLISQFEKDTKIKIKLLSGAKIVRLLEESKNPVANIFISNDIGQMEYLRREGLLSPYPNAPKGNIPTKFRAPDNSWIGLSARSRIFMYNKKLVSSSELPQNLYDLADPKYKGQFMITRGGNGSMIAHVAALSSVWGKEKTTKWIKAIKDNAGAIVHGHTQIRKGVGSGEFKFGLVNNYYYHLQLQEKKQNHVGAVYPDQGPKGLGIFVNAAGVALIKNSKNQKEAKIFLDWLLTKENQRLFTSTSLETPLNPTLEAFPRAKKIDQYRSMDLPLAQLGEKWSLAKSLIENAGLDLAVK